jgi:hypothetical protein
MCTQACLTDPCGLQEIDVLWFAPPAALAVRQSSYSRTLLPSQPSTAVTHCILIATNLPTPEGWTAWLTVSAPGFELEIRQTRVQ